MSKLARILWVLGLFVACKPETAPKPQLRTLVAQRVTATVKRAAAWLVHIRTERELLVTTPEHPFATPQAGWSPAGELVPGDQVASARFGTLRVLSVQREKRVEPQAVFNLTVAPSHTYLVGTGQALVHNKKCTDPAQGEKELEDAERELEALRLKFVVASAEEKTALQPQLAEVKGRIAKLKNQTRAARKKKNAGVEAGSRQFEPPATNASAALDKTPFARTVRAIEAIEREQKAPGATPQRMEELKRERAKLRKYLTVLRCKEKKERGIARLSPRQRALQRAEAVEASLRAALETAQSDLSKLLGEEPQSDAEKLLHEKRKAKLEKESKILRSEHAVSKEILVAERRLAELAERSPSTDAERQQVAAEQRELSAVVSRKRTAQGRRAGYRKARADAEAYEALLQKHRNWRRKWFRTPEYLADPMRPRDTLELLEEELRVRRQGAGSEIPDERTEYLKEHIATLQSIVELIKERQRLQNLLGSARRRHGGLLGAGQDTRANEQRIAQLKQERDAARVRGVQLRLRETLLKLLDGTTRVDRPGALDEARLREFERELEGELAAGGHLREARLREIQHDLGQSELIDAEFLESIWREAESGEGASPELQEAVRDEAADVDALLRGLSESLGTSSSPERTAAVETNLQALQRELLEERRAVEAADFALANEHAFLSQTLGRPGSSHGAAGARRLEELQQQRMQLRIDWRNRMQGRLDAARQELQIIQGVERFRDEAVEAELARRVALLEYEVNTPSF